MEDDFAKVDYEGSARQYRLLLEDAANLWFEIIGVFLCAVFGPVWALAGALLNFAVLRMCRAAKYHRQKRRSYTAYF